MVVANIQRTCSFKTDLDIPSAMINAALFAFPPAKPAVLFFPPNSPAIPSENTLQFPVRVDIEIP
jgi:hypothetical protein